jgi:hypothetical protein
MSERPTPYRLRTPEPAALRNIVLRRLSHRRVRPLHLMADPHKPVRARAACCQEKTAEDWPPPRYQLAQTRLASEAGRRTLDEGAEVGIQGGKAADARQRNHIRCIDMYPRGVRGGLDRGSRIVQVNISDVNVTATDIADQQVNVVEREQPSILKVERGLELRGEVRRASGCKSSAELNQVCGWNADGLTRSRN